MEYHDFSQEQKWYINGVLVKYMDTYVRDHLIWTPEQMYHVFIEYLRSFHKKGWYGKQSYKNGVYSFLNKEEELWMVSEDAEEFILSRFQKKYEKNFKLVFIIDSCIRADLSENVNLIGGAGDLAGHM